MKMKFEFFVAAVIALVMIGCGTNKQLTTETGMLWIEEARHLDSGSVISEKMPDGELFSKSSAVRPSQAEVCRCQIHRY